MPHRFLCAAALITLTLPASAAPPRRPKDYWNPAEAAGDVVLPAPCGGAMVFRRVDTTVGANWLADEEMQLGNSQVEGQEHSESILRDSIAGALTQDGSPQKRFYLLGKYEVTRDQYRAVMEQTCPTPEEDGARPAEGMTWLSAVTFAERYTEWLYAQDPKLLPKLAPGAFLRLPTEEEWEFAARGGLAVTEAVRRQKLPPMQGPPEESIWYSGHKSCDGSTQPIGILDANPLGLHDMIGNVQEMVSEPYRLRTRSRAHGQTGGATARGGSCLTTEARLRTSERDEIAPFDTRTGKAAGKPFTGIRLAVGAPILTGQDRISAINRDWKAFGETRLQLAPGQDPIQTLGTIAEAEESPEIRDAITDAIRRFEAEMEARNTVEAKSAKLALLSGTLMIRDYLVTMDNVIGIGAVLRNAPGDAELGERLKRAQERLDLTQDMFLASLVHAAESFSPEVVRNAAAIVGEENRLRTGSMTAHTRRTTQEMLDMFVEFVGTYHRRSDTDPQEFYDKIEKYYLSLRQR